MAEPYLSDRGTRRGRSHLVRAFHMLFGLEVWLAFGAMLVCVLCCVILVLLRWSCCTRSRLIALDWCYTTRLAVAGLGVAMTACCVLCAATAVSVFALPRLLTI